MLAKLQNFEYNGPGLLDWLTSFGATILIALEINARGARDMVQSGVSYYFIEPGIESIHTISVSLNILFLVCAGLWIIGKFKKPAQWTMIGIAAVAVVLCWAELLYSLRLIEGAVYTLPELPWRPINNLGIVGAQVFGSYLIFKLPQTSLKAMPAFLVKAGLCVCLWFAQAVAWQAFFVPR